MATIGEKFINQLTSGRWLLTMLAGLAYFIFSVTVSYVIVKTYTQFKPETLVAMFSALLIIATGVYKDYFNKIRDGNGNDSENGNGRNNTPTPPVPPSK